MFEERFVITLKKESPVVLVLSQLDYRYFDGLQGQYIFRLHFRLHEKGSSNEEDYIVRSHGNYLMDRSVVTELKALEAGTYSVFLMVDAIRDAGAPSVEDVIKQQCKRRMDNDKLAQVGTAYDLAHSKGATFLKAKAAARTALDKAKAQEARIALRKKNWEKRRRNREYRKAQEKKNSEKRERKEAEKAAQEEKKASEKPKDKAVQTERTNETQSCGDDKAVQTDVVDSGNLSRDMHGTTGDSVSANAKDGREQGDNTSESSVASQDNPDTPKGTTPSSSPPPNTYIIVDGPPPPPPPVSKHGKLPSHYQRVIVPQQNYVTSDDESSASPVSDFDPHSDDDPTLKPRPLVNTGESPKSEKYRDDSDDEGNSPEPWNAICIIGLRVYSMDENLQLKACEHQEVQELSRLKKKKTPKEDESDMDGDTEECGDKSNAKIEKKAASRSRRRHRSREKSVIGEHVDQKEGN